jgi:hypothetical protein
MNLEPRAQIPFRNVAVPFGIGPFDQTPVIPLAWPIFDLSLPDDTCGDRSIVDVGVDPFSIEWGFLFVRHKSRKIGALCDSVSQRT